MSGQITGYLLFIIFILVRIGHNTQSYDQPGYAKPALLLSNPLAASRNLSILCAIKRSYPPLVTKHKHDKVTRNLIFIHCLLATQISDVESNPGPKYPCGTCQKAVTWKCNALPCDSCNQWFHINCQGIGDETYDRLPNSSFAWKCLCCNSLNYSTHLSDSLNSLSNTSSFSPLMVAGEHTTTPPKHSHDSNPMEPPRASSTPKSADKTKGKHPKSLHYNQRISILNINCRSVRNKIPELHQTINKTKADVICLTETWLTPEIHNSEIFPMSLGYSVYRDDRTNSKGGGVLIAVSDRLLSQDQPQLKTDCNIVWTKISISGLKDIFVSSFYKPHEHDEHSLKELWTSISKIPKNSHIWIFGDFNLPNMDWQTQTPSPSCRFSELYDSFSENLTNFNLEQMVKTPTRDKNILDLFLTNNPSVVHNIQTLPSLGSSDHDIVHHELNIKRGRPLQVKRKIRSYKNADWANFKNDLDQFSVKFIQQNHTDPNTSWNCFKDEFNRLTNKYIPSRLSKSRQDLPWVTHEIVKLIRKRDKLYKKIKRSTSHNPVNMKSFKSLKSVIQNKIRNAYWSYLDSIIFSDNSNDGQKKKFYSFIKHNKTENSGVAPLSSNGSIHTDPVTKANILNKQFESVFSRPQPLSLKQIAKSAATKLSHPTMSPINISVQGVDKLLTGLNPNKASGPDEISPRLLKELHSQVAPILTHIFQLSLDTGIVPDDWKHAVISPVYKKGDKSKASNYRPISLTCIASKLLEHIIVSNMMSYFDANNVLSPKQHGFRSKHSCETQLIGFSQEIADSLDQGQQTDVIVMDFSKAFDKVDHHKLVHKLKRLGIDNKVTSWIRSFLTNRSQQVLVEGNCSDRLPVLSGVPQGSVLGPCLFLAYINDLPDSVKSRVRLFADDTIVYLVIRSSSSAESLQQDLKLLELWEQDWAMEFNPDKCEILRIHRKKKPILFPYRLHDTLLKSADKSKYLGVTISKDLNWAPHINNITAKANSTLRFIKRNVKTSKRKVKETAFKTYVRPQVEYCSTVWCPWQKYLKYKIEMVQRSAARYVMNDYSYTSSVTDMINTLNWQTLEQRREYSSLIMFYKIRSNLVAVDNHHLRPTRNLNYNIPPSSSNFHAASFFPRTIRLWNSLPIYVQESPSLPIFAGRLESHSM